MKRTRKAPKHHDLQARDGYRMCNPYDEWDLWLDFCPEDVEPVAADDMRRRMPNELNHIMTNPRVDRAPLLITLSKTSHDFFHANLQEGRVLCLLVKFIKGEQDLELWNKAFGKSVEGWARNRDFSSGHWCYPYWKKLLGWFDELAREKREAA